MADPQESYPGIHPLEFVPEEELAQISAMGRVAIERKFRGDFAVFSTDLLIEMIRINALTENGGWAAYIQYDDRYCGDLAAQEFGDTVINYSPGLIDEKGRQIKTPSVRFTTSEKIAVEDGVEFLTHDLSIDEDADAFYCYGSYPVRDSLDAFESIVPIFQYDQEGRIGCSSSKIYMPRLAPGDKDDFKRSVIFLPFGHYSDPSTKIAVLEKMKELYSKIKGSEPFAWSGMANQTGE
jgi:hypothetical protein